MRPRSLALAGLAVTVFAVMGAVLWPSIADSARRQIVERLRDETGQDWRVEGVGLTFGAGPQIVLRDVAFGDDREGSSVAGARIRAVRLTDPVSLVLGSGSSGRAVADGVRLRVPLAGQAGAPPGAASARRTGKAAAIRITARGGEAALAEAGRAAVASAETLEIDFDLAPTRTITEIRATLELPASTATAALDWAPSGEEPGAVSFRLDPRETRGHRLAASAKADLRATGLTLDSLLGTIDDAPIKGTVSVDWGPPKPRIALDAQLDALTLTDAAEAARLDAKPEAGLVVPVTPDLIPDVRWFSGFEATGRVGVARLTLGPTRFETVSVTGSVKNGGLDAALASAAGYGGNARGRYVLVPEADGAGRHQIGVSLSRVQVLALLSDMVGVRGIDGTGTLRVDLQAKGTEIAAIRRSLSGSADLAVTNGRIDGLDLAGAIGLIPANGARGGGMGTRLDRLAGSFSLAEGQAVTNDLAVKTALIEATGIGSIDLIERSLDIRLKPQVVAPGAGRQSGARNPLDVPVRIAGPWTNPSVSADLSGLAENPSGTLQSLQDLGSGILGDGGGGDIGEALGGLLDGFLGKSDRGSPVRRKPRPLDADPDSAR